jgi:anti-sigma B factor antagonist
MTVPLNRRNSVLALTGRFDAHETPSFLRDLEPLLADTGSDITLDLSNVVFIDSIALSELVSLHKKLYDAGRTLLLVSPSDSVRVILEITGLVTLFNVVLSNQTSPINTVESMR